MSTRRNGDERLSGEAHRPEDAPRLGPTTERDVPSGLDDLAERIGEALRRQPVDDRAEQAALAAFRSARTANDEAVRTRRRDDWRPRTRTRRWARGGALALAAGTLLGGVAVASIGVVDGARHHRAPEAGTSHSTHRPATSTPGDQGPASSGSGTAPTALPSRPATAKDIEAHCRAYEKIKGRGHALDATAWQRLVHAAGGERQVPGYCAQLTGSAHDAPPAPARTDKAQKTGGTKNAGKAGKGQGRPSAEARPSKGPGSSGNRP
ncbi:hypothetical protein ACIBJF_16685 [Streptomyces sp. NPDC050743]|uniref:hypothetical protein n=1 Tax=Streptomyces sp. NPDC050743 TaxID=3365634 RepID=UPI0037935543